MTRWRPEGKLNRFEKLQGLYDDAETMLVMLDEEYDPEMVPEAEEAVNGRGQGCGRAAADDHAER